MLAKQPQLAIGVQPAKGPSAVAPKVDCVPPRVLDLGESPEYNLEEFEDLEEVCFRVETPKVGKARKGLGPSRDRPVGVLAALTPIGRPGPKGRGEEAGTHGGGSEGRLRLAPGRGDIVEPGRTGGPSGSR